MKIFIFGCKGNMAKRYAAILEHLGHSWCGEDLDYSEGLLSDCDAVIVATPTDTHVKVLRQILDCGKPILCEKPITKDLKELRQLMADCVLAGTKLQMVSQYDHLVDWEGRGPSYYDYFKTGPDGMPWDCLQIIWLAKGEVEIGNKSPVWICKINGMPLDLNDMDGAYVDEIKAWLNRPRNDIGRILDSHEKVARLEASWQRKS